MSLDEAYLDLTDYLTSKSSADPEISASKVVEEMRSKIAAATNGLTASAGIAPNALLAKVCSDLNKPNGQYELKADEDEIMAFVRPLSIRKVGGIGNVTEQLLKSVDVATCGDLYEQRGVLKLLFSEISSTSFLRTSLGIGSTFFANPDERERKSISTETTFRDCDDREQLFDLCVQLSKDLAGDLEKEGLKGRAVTLKIKTHDFNVKTKVKTLLEPTSNVEVIEATAKSILRHFMETLGGHGPEKRLKLRLMGVRMSDFATEEASENQERREQKTLDSFLRNGGAESKKASENLTAFHCPICGNEIHVQSEQHFNSHLDECLRNSETQIGKDDGARNSDEATCSTRDLTSSSVTAGAESKVEKSKVEEQSTFQCPICFKSITLAVDGNANTDTQVNRHVDECLNKPEISRISKVSQGLKRISGDDVKVMRDKRPKNSIQNYFAKK